MELRSFATSPLSLSAMNCEIALWILSKMLIWVRSKLMRSFSFFSPRHELTTCFAFFSDLEKIDDHVEASANINSCRSSQTKNEYFLSSGDQIRFDSLFKKKTGSLTLLNAGTIETKLLSQTYLCSISYEVDLMIIAKFSKLLFEMNFRSFDIKIEGSYFRLRQA